MLADEFRVGVEADRQVLLGKLCRGAECEEAVALAAAGGVEGIGGRLAHPIAGARSMGSARKRFEASQADAAAAIRGWATP